MSDLWTAIETWDNPAFPRWVNKPLVGSYTLPGDGTLVAHSQHTSELSNMSIGALVGMPDYSGSVGGWCAETLVTLSPGTGMQFWWVSVLVGEYIQSINDPYGTPKIYPSETVVPVGIPLLLRTAQYRNGPGSVETYSECVGFHIFNSLEFGYAALGLFADTYGSSTPDSRVVFGNVKVAAFTDKAQYTNFVSAGYFPADPPIPPSVYPPPSTYQGVQLVILKSSQSLPIHYTMDGSEPTISSPLYTGPIPVYQDTQIKAAAFYGNIPSDTVTASYTITNGILPKIQSYRDRVLPYLLEQYKGDNP